MKTLTKLFLLVAVLINSISGFSQTCINESETHKPWTNIPYFDGADSYIWLENTNSDENATDWIENSFSIDMWVKPTFPSSGADAVYTMFSGGTLNSDKEALFIYFDEYSSGQWQIRVGDGEADGTEYDLRYGINYDAFYKDKWKHITVTYDQSELSLYIDGEFATSQTFDIDYIPGETLTIGNRNNHSYDFRGEISGFRIWKDHKLSSDEINYVWNKTFNEEETFNSDFSYLYKYLAINMFTDVDNIYSLTPNTGMIEVGISRKTYYYHPGKPVNAYNFSATRNCDNVTLNWTDGTSYTTNYIYRKLEGASDSVLICRTNSNYYIDNQDEENGLQAGKIYTYSIVPVWYNPNDPLNTDNGYYKAEVHQITTSLKKYGQVQNFRVTQDATLNNCNGEVLLEWDDLDIQPDSYIIECKIQGGNYNTIAQNLTGTSYTHTVGTDSLGKELTYIIDGSGDGCTNYSEPVTGLPNTESSIAPNNVNASVVNNNIEITWDFSQPNSSSTAFRIYRSTDGGATYAVLQDEISINDRSFTDETAMMCTNYYYQVEAYNSCGTNNSVSSAVGPVKIPVKFDNVFTYDDSGIEKSYFDGSKGYYSQRVELEWIVNPDKKTDIENIEIYRKKPEYSYTLIETINNANSSTYSDNQTDANQIYDYMIRATGHCGDTIVISDSLTTIGFRTSTGIVSGKITYSGGNAVKDVDVRVAPNNPVESSSLLFNGINSMLHTDPITKLVEDSLVYKSMTFEAWVKPELSTSGYRKIIFSEDLLRLNFYLVNMRPVLVLNDTNELDTQTPIAIASADTVLNADTWYHLAFSLNAENGVIKIFLNGEEIASTNYTPVIPWGNPDADYQRIQIGGSFSSSQNLSFKGNIDEIRLWQEAKSEEEIARDYKRLLVGDEENLLAYWHCDENYGNSTYDISKKGTEFNKCDLTSKDSIERMPQWSSQTPSFEQLHPAGISDDRGNYIIKGIRYTGDGDIFNIAPSLGVHEFDPTDVNLFISDNTPVHNNIDFTDISSFRVTGRVFYEGTTINVKDCYVKVDGNYIHGENNQVVMTDDNGQFDIQVPIGEHYITVEKQGHTFVSAFFPPQTSPDTITKYNFNDDIYGLTFKDNTKVKLAGKVVGGAVEQAKPLGSNINPINNNLGVCNITIETLDGSFLYNEKPDTSIVTDASTGIYEIELPPESYKFTTVKVSGSPYDFLGSENEIINLSDCFEKKYTIDSVENESGEIEADTTFIYNKQKDWIWRNSPQISVYDYSGSKVLGDSLYIIRIGDPDQDTIQIAQMNGENPYYAFNRPVFSQERAYAFVISAFEEYENYDTGNTDTVPVTDGEVIIINECANNQNQISLGINEDGYSLYRFFGGLPNISEPFTKKMEIKLKVGEDYYDWSQSPLYGYVCGNLPTGNNFVTKGPEKVDYVLRDPPGSNSYSYLEQGLEINFSKTTTTNKAWEGSEKATFHLGNSITTTSGTPFFSVDLELDITKDIALGFEHSTDWGNEHETNDHIAFNQTFTTSSDPAYVGDMGDVFLGHGTNILFGAANFIQITNINDIPLDATAIDTVVINSEEYAVCKKKGLYLGNEFSTTFVYSQNHIENYLIPNLQMLRNAAYSSNSQYYTLNFTDQEDEKFLSNNDDEFIWGNDASEDKFDGPSYVYNNSNQDDVIDSVRYYNNQIIAWRNILKDNEEDKLNGVADDNFPGNISFDAGATYEASVETSEGTVDTKSFELMLSPSLSGEIGFVANNHGFSFEIEQKYVYTKNTTTSYDTTHIQTVGFVLEDGDQGDYFSVNIKKDTTQNFGPIFRTQGGQSACPYEGATYTKYYNPGTILNQATMQIEVPHISTANNIVSGVPETAPAVFNLELSNNSESEDDVWYTLLVDASSNPYGAIVSIDGDPATSEGKSILVRSGETTYKTLTIEKGQPDFNDIDSLIVILHSQCQFDPTDDVDDIADTVYLSAHFVPACTAVDFNQIYDNWTANVENNDTISFQITDYNLNSTKFESIKFQYAIPGGARTTAMTFAKGSGVNTEDTTWINGETTINYDFNIENLNDGTYELYLKSVCDDGSEYLTNPLTGIIDRVTPRAFGTPQPADGILSPNDEISLQFNEDVNSGDFYSHPEYIELRGIPNGTDLVDNEYLMHDASIHFDGDNDNMLVPNGINLNNTSFTIEFWAKRNRTGRECIVSLGSENTGLWIGFNENDKFTFKLGTDMVNSDNTFATLDTWAHYACTYFAGDDQYEPSISIIVLSDAISEEKYAETNSYTYLEDALYLAYSPNDASAFMGNIHDFRIWNVKKTYNEINADKGKILNGNEQALYGLWPMNEASGNFAHDKAFGRTAQVNATWNVSRNGKAIAFNGASYAVVPTPAMSFDNQTNFTIEFWFKAQMSGNDMCLLSNGLSDGTYGDNSWTITAKTDNTILVQNKGIDVSFDASNYLNNNWQHFSMTLNRQGYLSIYMNGELVKTVPGNQFGGFGASQIVVGSHWWVYEQTEHFEDYFTGEIDELRIWNTVRSVSQIERYKNNALKCSEFGLKAYFPFENVNIPEPGTSVETLENLTADESTDIAGDMILNNAIFTNESPNIKLQGAETIIPFTYVINDDNVIITPSINDADIENVILDISVKNVLDLHNNRMSSPVTWTAYIDKNQMVWDRQELNVEKFIDEEAEFTVNIQNKGGLSENFEIKNIPDWAEVNPTEGSLDPLEIQKVTITVKPILNIGNYSRDINLVSSMGFNERLNLNVKVKGHEPEWNVDPDAYEYSANLIGQLKINGVLSTDTYDKVAAFINGECRGSAYVQYLEEGNMYLLFMDIYDNNVSGNNITFKVYDASTGEVYSDVTPQLTFSANSIYGTSSDPVQIEATMNIEQNLSLNSGWNWLSFNVFNDNFNDLNIALNNVNAVQGDIIKSQNAFSQYTSNNSWAGSLTSLNYFEMYKMKLANSQTFTVSGAKIISDTVDINIVPGWNWIGYPAQTQMSITEAMSSLTPSADDLLKSQQKFAIFDTNLGWIGSLTYLEPAKGYMLKSASGGTLIYSGSNKSSNYLKDDLSYVNPTASNMTMIAELELDNSEYFVLKAYSNGNLCGIANPQNINGKIVYFITINSENGNKINFKADNNGTIYQANETETFYDNAHIGSVEKAVKLTFGATNINEIGSEATFDLYPNPFDDKLILNMNLPESENIILEVYNTTGRKVLEIKRNNYSSGVHNVNLSREVNNLASGIYMLKIRTDNKEQFLRVVKK